MTIDFEAIVRPARIEDVPALQDFIRPFVESDRLLPRTTGELTSLIEHGFIAELQNRIAGFAALEIYSAKLAEVRSLAVAPIHQGRGIGRRLIDACIERAKEHSVLEVMAITATEEFFQRCGFDYTLPGQKKALFIQTR